MWCKDRRPETGDGRREISSTIPKRTEMVYKFQSLKVYDLALSYLDEIYDLARQLPRAERLNLQSQLQRAAASIVLNIAEGSTGQSDAEQGRFLGLALRSYLETVACFDIIERRAYLTNDALCETRAMGHDLFVKLQAFRQSLKPRPETEDGRRPSPVSGHRSSVSRPPSPVSRPPSAPGATP